MPQVPQVTQHIECGIRSRANDNVVFRDMVGLNCGLGTYIESSVFPTEAGRTLPTAVGVLPLGCHRPNQRRAGEQRIFAFYDGWHRLITFETIIFCVIATLGNRRLHQAFGRQ